MQSAHGPKCGCKLVTRQKEAAQFPAVSEIVVRGEMQEISGCGVRCEKSCRLGLIARKKKEKRKKGQKSGLGIKSIFYYFKSFHHFVHQSYVRTIQRLSSKCLALTFTAQRTTR